jgi:hypothetical protein
MNSTRTRNQGSPLIDNIDFMKNIFLKKMKKDVTTLHFDTDVKKDSKINVYLSKKCSKSYVTLTLHYVTLISLLDKLFTIIIYLYNNIFIYLGEDEKKKITI